MDGFGGPIEFFTDSNLLDVKKGPADAIFFPFFLKTRSHKPELYFDVDHFTKIELGIQDGITYSYL